jgi:hypothetical protein
MSWTMRGTGTEESRWMRTGLRGSRLGRAALRVLHPSRRLVSRLLHGVNLWRQVKGRDS